VHLADGDVHDVLVGVEVQAAVPALVADAAVLDAGYERQAMVIVKGFARLVAER
jgi:hypothetical protein